MKMPCPRSRASSPHRTAMEKAQRYPMREILFKIGARIFITVRQVWTHNFNAHRFSEIFETAVKKIRRLSRVET
jgi:hypothetical protein